MSARRRRAPRAITRAALRALPLPAPQADGDKESRGRVLVVGGSARVPGALLLAGLGALRAGAGKLQLATARPAAVGLGLEVPEAMVVPLAASRLGEIAGARAAAPLRALVGGADAVLIGPGMATAPAVGALLRALAPLLGAQGTLVLDGAAAVSLGASRGGRAMEDALHALGGRVIVTPHAGEMAALTGMDKREVEGDAPAAAARAAERFGAVFVLKGPDTWIADAAGSRLHHRGQLPGLGTSGSGDTLAGIVAGLAARGATPLAAAAWGVWAHATAGRRLAARMGAVGFLARELLAEVPALLGRLPA